MAFLLKDVIHLYEGKGVTNQTREDTRKAIRKLESLYHQPAAIEYPGSSISTEEGWAEYIHWKAFCSMLTDAQLNETLTQEEHGLLSRLEVWFQIERMHGHFEPEYLEKKSKEKKKQKRKFLVF